MGGATKKPLTKMEKLQQREEQAVQQKRKEAKREQTQSKQLSFLPPKMNDEQILNTLAPMKAITVYAAAKALGLRASVTSVVLRNLHQKGLLRKEGGFSGHPIYVVNK